jgi:hypothetical protein
MPDGDRTDKSSYAPFILADDGKYRSLILTDRDMIAKTHVFEERKAEGWIGSGYDWTSVARVLLIEQLPDLQSGQRSIPRRLRRPLPAQGDGTCVPDPGRVAS